MSVEIERKFLVVGEAWREQAHEAIDMDQGYLVAPGGRASVRVRVHGEQARLNIKAAVVGAERAEFDYPIPFADGEEMLNTLSIGRVQKTRHLVRIGDHEWEVDEFAGDNRGLVVAEIELDHVEAAFERPDWLGEEVTDDERYYNHRLSVTPYCRWHGGEGA